MSSGPQMKYRPLHISDEGRHKSCWEVVFRLIPIIGPAVVVILADSRIANETRKLHAQIEGRSERVWDQWTDEGVRSTARTVCKIIADELEWPNDLFLPDDSMEAVLIDSDCRLTDVLERIENVMNIRSGTLCEEYPEHLTSSDVCSFVRWINSLL